MLKVFLGHFQKEKELGKKGIQIRNQHTIIFK